jgi:hypothetical protein
MCQKEQNMPHPLAFILFFVFQRDRGNGSTKAPQAHSSAGTPSIRWLTRRGVIQTGSLRVWKIKNEQTRDIQLAYLIICATPDLCLGGTQNWNKDQRRSFTNLEICPGAPTSIVYRPQSHPSLLKASLRPAYLEILWSLALSASVSQSHVSSTKDILCWPWTCQGWPGQVSAPCPKPGLTWGLQSFQVAVYFKCTQALRGKL